MESSSPFMQGHPAGVRSHIATALTRTVGFVSRIYFAIFGFFAAPFNWMLAPVERLDDRMLARGQSRTWYVARFADWLLRLPVRFVRWLLESIVYLIIYGLLWVIGIILFALFVGVPIQFTEWVGGVWYGGLATWFWFRADPKWWWRAAARIGKLVAFGVTPQVIFLLLYNGLLEQGLAPPALLEAVVKQYEHFAVVLNGVLAPIADVPWFYWIAAAGALILVSLVLEAPVFVGRVLRLRQALSVLVFLASITGSVGFSSLVAIKDWDPDIQHRLQAKLKEQAFYDSTITLSEDLTRWFTSDRARVTVLPGYVRSFEEAIRDINSTSKDVTSEDIHKGTKQAARGLVPADAAGIAVADGGPVHSSPPQMPGTAEDLLRHDAELRRSNLEIKARATQIRAAAVNAIAQIVNVQVSSEPMLREILGEMINAAAEQISQRIVDRLPIERGMKAVRGTSETIHQSVSTNSDKIAEALFASRGPVAAEGVHPSIALKAAVAHEIGKVSRARIQAEIHARSSGRVRR